MKFLKNKFLSIILLILFPLSFNFSFRVNDKYEKYCYSKYITSGDQIIISFVITSYPKELINVDLKYHKQKYDTRTIVYQVFDKDQGNYQSEKPLDEGYYELCFYSKKGKDYYVSMEYYTLFEDHNIKQLVTDKEFKTINNDIKDMKAAFHKIQTNARHLYDRKFSHMSILKELIDSIKRLTYLKIFTVAVLSAFQIYIIQKFFGPDKRVSTIKGSFSDKNNIL
jgi:hypothetical protein